MAEIPYWFWVFAGIAIAITSLYVREDMHFFVYIGIVFVLFGILKISLKMFSKKPHSAGACPRCGRKIGRANFCSYCGARIR